MDYVLVVVTGQGRYEPHRVPLDPQHRTHLKRFLEWSRLTAEAALGEGPHIMVRISILDMKGNISKDVVFPFTFGSGISAQEDAPTPFQETNIPRIGYIGVPLVNLNRLTGEAKCGQCVKDSLIGKR